MINKALMCVALLLGCCAVQAQVAQWILRPTYDRMTLTEGEKLLVTETGNTKGLWDFEGKKLFEGEGRLYPFCEGLAVLSDNHSLMMKGFLSRTGEWFPFDEGVYQTAKSSPSFSNGLLLAYDVPRAKYLFISKDNRIVSKSYVDAFPFFNGYASCQYYLTPDKEKDLRYELLAKDMRPVVFSFKNKDFAPSDIYFVSSVNDQDLCVLVARNKLYLYHPKQKTLMPVCAESGSDNLKYQAKVQGDVTDWLLKNGGGFIIQAHCGKAGYVVLSFDKNLIPVSIRYSDNEQVYQRKEPVARKLHTHLSDYMSSWRHGLLWENAEVLPPQFDEAAMCFEDMAIVKVAGKYGLLKVFPDDQFKVSIYKGKDIPFKHETFETTLRLDVPAYVPTAEVTMATDPDSGFEIDMTSGEAKDTQWGNYVEYRCTLRMPEKLSDEEPEELVYVARVNYTGLISPVIPVKAKAWHYKYFVVDVIDAETVLNNGTLSFAFNINESRDPGEDLYRKRVAILADSLSVSIEKISEIRYKVRATELKEGLNNIIVQIIEQGCPPVSFPFEIVYTKPVEETKGKKTAKEAVVIKKKPYVPYIKM